MSLSRTHFWSIHHFFLIQSTSISPSTLICHYSSLFLCSFPVSVESCERYLHFSLSYCYLVPGVSSSQPSNRLTPVHRFLRAAWTSVFYQTMNDLLSTKIRTHFHLSLHISTTVAAKTNWSGNCYFNPLTQKFFFFFIDEFVIVEKKQ